MKSGKIAGTLREGFTEGGFLLLFWRLLLITLLFSISRFLFYLFNGSAIPASGFRQIAGLFLQGLRFDISNLLLLNVPCLVFYLLPFRGKNRPLPRIMLKAWLVIANGLALLAAHMVYFRFSNSTLNIRDLWQVVLITSVFVWLLFRFYYPTRAIKGKYLLAQGRGFHLPHLAWSLLLAMVFVVGARGGLAGSALLHRLCRLCPWRVED